MMTTRQIFETRKAEVELCYSILLDLKLDEQPAGQTIAIDRAHTENFAPILKSNILLMLYNLVEACVTSGFVEIYDCIKDNNLAYSDLIGSIRNIWSNYEIKRAHNTTATQMTYEKRVQEIISDVINGNAIILTKDALAMSGNLDAKGIRKLLDDHNIRISDRSDKYHMLMVKNKRNALAHGNESFCDCAREVSIIQLAEIKSEVLDFIDKVIGCMAIYYDTKLFRKI